MMPNLDVHFSSKNMNLQTPPNVLEAIRGFGGIGLDPCTVESNPTGAQLIYTPAEDGLAQPWDNSWGLTFFNPPYGREIGLWTQKARREISIPKHTEEIIGLVPARTDTKWWQEAYFDAVCFWKGRLHFIDPETGEPCLTEKGKPAPAPFPSALLYWGHDVEGFCSHFGRYGRCYVEGP